MLQIILPAVGTADGEAERGVRCAFLTRRSIAPDGGTVRRLRLAHKGAPLCLCRDAMDASHRMPLCCQWIRGGMLGRRLGRTADLVCPSVLIESHVMRYFDCRAIRASEAGEREKKRPVSIIQAL